MLEGVAVVGDIIIVVVGIGEEVVARSKDVARRQVGRGQEGLGGVLDDKEVLGVIGQILAQLVAQIGIGVAVADNLDGIGSPNATVVGGDDDAVVSLCQQAEQIGDDRMAEPRQGDGTVGRLVISQLAHHLRLSTGMGEHVDEVEDDDVEVVLLQRVQLLQQLVGLLRGVDLMIGEGVMAAIAFQLGADERFLVEVLALLLVLVDPQVGEHSGYLVGHQSGEDGIAGILRRRGQDAAIDVLVNFKLITNLALQHLPLVVAEVVEHNEEHLLALIEQGKHLGLEDVGT